MTKYIIALLAQNPGPYVHYARTHFAASQEHYLIGEASKPHVTLAQFYSSDKQAEEIACQVAAKQLKAIEPTFSGITLKKDEMLDDIWWVSCSSHKNTRPDGPTQRHHGHPSQEKPICNQ